VDEGVIDEMDRHRPYDTFGSFDSFGSFE